jgi:DNA invertase Pin-like site-specific DNA recombinase
MVMTMKRKAALYLRVSTGEQTTENQRRALEGVAAKAGWHVAAVFEDAGVSGAKGRGQRPGYDALLKAITRREVDLVAAWSVDRLGRSVQDLIGFLTELHGRGADLYLHQQALDTTTPSGRAMFGMMAVFAEFERAMIQERVKAGLARVREHGSKSGKPIGRPRIASATEARIHELRGQGMGLRKIAQTLGIGVSAVQRVTGAA